MSDKNMAKKIKDIDIELGYLAKARDLKSKSSDYIDLDKVERKLTAKKSKHRDKKG